MAAPVIENDYVEADSGGSTATSLVINKPAGDAAGDLFLLLMGSDSGEGSAQWQTPSGWTQLYNDFDAADDVNLAAFIRVRDGTEGASVTVNHTAADELWGVWMRITGAFLTTTPDAIAALTNDNTSLHVCTAVTTTVDECLVISHGAYDGGDATLSVSSGTGWTFRQQNSGVTENDASGWWAEKDVTTAGGDTALSISMTLDDGCYSRMISIAPTPTDPAITDVETDEAFRDGDTAVTITGINFEATQGTGTVELSDNAVYATGTKVAQTVTSWADTSIDFTAVLGALAPGTLWIWVTNNTGDRNAAFNVQVSRKIAFQLSASGNIAASGENTTAQLTAPSGKTSGTDFDAGRIQDDENPADAVTVSDDDYTEMEWAIQATNDAADGVQYEFRLVALADGVLDTYTVTPRWTVTATAANLDYSDTISDLNADHHWIFQGLGASSATVAAGGTGYTVGDQLTLVGGTSSETAVFNVDSETSGVVTAVSVVTDGAYTSAPASPVSTTGGTGTGCTLTVTFEHPDEIGSAHGVNSGATAVLTPIARSAVATLESNGTTDRVTIPNTADINNSAQDRKAVAGWILVTAVQEPPKRIYGEGNNTQSFAFVMGWGNNLLLEADSASFTLQVYTDRVLQVNRAYHLCGIFEGSGFGDELRLYLDGVKQLDSEPSPPAPGVTTLAARTPVEFADPVGTVSVGGTTVILNAPVNGQYNHWATWNGANAVLSDATVRELFEKGALGSVTISTDTQVNMQTALDALSATTRPDQACCIEIEEQTGGGDFTLDVDNITFDALASIHVRYNGNDGSTLTLRNLNGSNTSIVAAPWTASIAVVEVVDLTITVLDASTLLPVENAVVYGIAGATGPLTQGTVIIDKLLTNASGVVTQTFDYSADQSITGRVRRGSTSPLYKTGPFSSTITSTGLVLTVLLIPDE